MDGWRPHIESALALDIWRMDRCCALHDGASGGWKWTRDGEQVATIFYWVKKNGDAGLLTLRYALADRNKEGASISCKIRLSSVPLNFGGRRWYAHCPYTGRRARKLYKFSGVELFCHRTAIRPLPTYATQRVSGWDRINAQRWALRKKLGDSMSDLFGEPFKPRRMRWKTFQRFLDRDAELQSREGGYFARHFAGLATRLGV